MEARSAGAFVPREKMSKKAKRALDRAKRGGWGALSPVTRTVESKKGYSRKKTRHEKEESFDAGNFFVFL